VAWEKSIIETASFSKWICMQRIWHLEEFSQTWCKNYYNVTWAM